MIPVPPEPRAGQGFSCSGASDQFPTRPFNPSIASLACRRLNSSAVVKPNRRRSSSVSSTPALQLKACNARTCFSVQGREPRLFVKAPLVKEPLVVRPLPTWAALAVPLRAAAP
ncbi:hypothetical protein CA12_33240 [Alienimonas californiensis]|uniref:Uncharacterized protein n=1 Tax=Alienimonas californiensis TaxID=2527989 RepID=A0A517PCV7_9PLAN|nr:hypothetical protein CA12_33240 [Alienimonas californiensis]